MAQSRLEETKREQGARAASAEQALEDLEGRLVQERRAWQRSEEAMRERVSELGEALAQSRSELSALHDEHGRLKGELAQVREAHTAAAEEASRAHREEVASLRAQLEREREDHAAYKVAVEEERSRLSQHSEALLQQSNRAHEEGNKRLREECDAAVRQAQEELRGLRSRCADLESARSMDGVGRSSLRPRPRLTLITPSPLTPRRGGDGAGRARPHAHGGGRGVDPARG